MRPAHSPMSVYERVLGERFAELDPGLRRYFGALPAGTAGVGRGVYSVAGSRVRILAPLLRVLTARHVLFPERGRDVPFTVVNRACGHDGLRGIRSFEFPERTRIMQDRMTVEGDRIVDRLGRRHGIEVAFAVAVERGGLRMTSQRWGWWIRGRRVPLPAIATVTVDERWEQGRQHVDVLTRVPVIGEVFRYTGAFRFEHVPIEALAGVPREALA